MNRNIITLPTSRDCPNKTPGCKVAKAHGLANDAESYFREAMNEMEPKSQQEMDDLEAIKGYANALMKSERAMRDILLRNGTKCPDAERCRCLCGMEYPQDTPAWGNQVLTDHIKVCEKHPMRKLELEKTILRKALAGLIGAEHRAELEQMEVAIRLAPVPDVDKAMAINAIHALLETED